MIISRTPFRVSFVGGGTDLPSFYKKSEGRVLSCAINKYLYVVVKKQLGIVEYKYRVNWSKVEFTNEIDELEHPIVREALRLLEIEFPIEITTFAEIPSGTGLGSSSAFAVGLLNALYALKGTYVSKNKLADEASKIEIDILGRKIGRQDHYASSYGSLNVFSFSADDTVSVEPLLLNSDKISELESNSLLFYTKFKRDAHKILNVQDEKNDENLLTLENMRDQVLPMRTFLSNEFSVENYGSFLHQGWESKRSLTSDISNSEIDKIYSTALSSGATGGKLLGAGGGGFSYSQ